MLDGECWTLDVGPVPLAPTGKRGHKDTRCVCVRILVRVEMAAREQVSLCVFIDVPWSPQNHTLVKGHWKLQEITQYVHSSKKLGYTQEPGPP